jgi:hypothetical protein
MPFQDKPFQGKPALGGKSADLKIGHYKRQDAGLKPGATEEEGEACRRLGHRGREGGGEFDGGESEIQPRFLAPLGMTASEHSEG